eukprot:2588586-Rhodomonas_salina.2
MVMMMMVLMMGCAGSLDIAVVLMMVLGVLPLGIDTGGFKCIRIVRVVRPLQVRLANYSLL